MDATKKMELLNLLNELKLDLVDRRYGDAFTDLDKALAVAEALPEPK